MNYSYESEIEVSAKTLVMKDLFSKDLREIIEILRSLSMLSENRFQAIQALLETDEDGTLPQGTADMVVPILEKNSRPKYFFKKDSIILIQTKAGRASYKSQEHEITSQIRKNLKSMYKFELLNTSEEFLPRNFVTYRLAKDNSEIILFFAHGQLTLHGIKYIAESLNLPFNDNSPVELAFTIDRLNKSSQLNKALSEINQKIKEAEESYQPNCKVKVVYGGEEDEVFDNIFDLEKSQQPYESYRVTEEESPSISFEGQYLLPGDGRYYALEQAFKEIHPYQLTAGLTILAKFIEEYDFNKMADKTGTNGFSNFVGNYAKNWVSISGPTQAAQEMLKIIYSDDLESHEKWAKIFEIGMDSILRENTRRSKESKDFYAYFYSISNVFKECCDIGYFVDNNDETFLSHDPAKVDLKRTEESIAILNFRNSVIAPIKERLKNLARSSDDQIQMFTKNGEISKFLQNYVKNGSYADLYIGLNMLFESEGFITQEREGYWALENRSSKDFLEPLKHGNAFDGFFRRLSDFIRDLDLGQIFLDSCNEVNYSKVLNLLQEEFDARKPREESISYSSCSTSSGESPTDSSVSNSGSTYSSSSLLVSSGGEGYSCEDDYFEPKAFPEDIDKSLNDKTSIVKNLLSENVLDIIHFLIKHNFLEMEKRVYNALSYLLKDGLTRASLIDEVMPLIENYSQYNERRSLLPLPSTAYVIFTQAEPVHDYSSKKSQKQEIKDEILSAVLNKLTMKYEVLGVESVFGEDFISYRFVKNKEDEFKLFVADSRLTPHVIAVLANHFEVEYSDHNPLELAFSIDCINQALSKAHKKNPDFLEDFLSQEKGVGYSFPNYVGYVDLSEEAPNFDEDSLLSYDDLVHPRPGDEDFRLRFISYLEDVFDNEKLDKALLELGEFILDYNFNKANLPVLLASHTGIKGGATDAAVEMLKYTPQFSVNTSQIKDMTPAAKWAYIFSIAMKSKLRMTGRRSSQTDRFYGLFYSVNDLFKILENHSAKKAAEGELDMYVLDQEKDDWVKVVNISGPKIEGIEGRGKDSPSDLRSRVMTKLTRRFREAKLEQAGLKIHEMNEAFFSSLNSDKDVLVPNLQEYVNTGSCAQLYIALHQLFKLEGFALEGYWATENLDDFEFLEGIEQEGFEAFYDALSGFLSQAGEEALKNYQEILDLIQKGGPANGLVDGESSTEEEHLDRPGQAVK